MGKLKATAALVLVLSLMLGVQNHEYKSEVTAKYDQSGQVKKACERFIAAN